jgi:hypothetical protein
LNNSNLICLIVTKLSFTIISFIELSVAMDLDLSENQNDEENKSQKSAGSAESAESDSNIQQ